ncbi:MAG: type II secretion system protein [Candidatus Wallbacteria bacterium]|nr:type II secretion system protein [Candidatus Wallbacteria bacterium]
MKPRSRQAFTLLEIMIALAILGSSLVVVLTSIFHSLEMYRVAKETVIAGFLAQEKFTELRTAKTGVGIGDYRDGVFEHFSRYHWSYRVDKVSLEPLVPTVPGLRRIEVQVTWDEHPRRHVQVISYVPDKELLPGRP